MTVRLTSRVSQFELVGDPIICENCPVDKQTHTGQLLRNVGDILGMFGIRKNANETQVELFWTKRV